MPIKTFGDLKKHLHNLDIDPLSKRLANWLEEQIRQMPGDVVALNLEWDLVGGDANDEIVGDVLGYQGAGIDLASPESWDWSSAEHDKFQFIGMGAIWSEAVEVLTDDEGPEVEEAVTATIDSIVLRALAASQEFGRRHAAGQLKFYWARQNEPLSEYVPSPASE